MTIKQIFYVFLLCVFSLEVGWYSCNTYAVHLIEAKHGVLKIEDYSRLREIEDKLKEEKFLFL